MKQKKYIKDFSIDEINLILNKFENNSTIKNIANEHNSSTTTISKILKLNNKNIISNKNKYNDLRNIPLNELQKEFIVGTVLGDSCLHKDNENSNYKLSFSHSIKQQEYFNWKVNILSPFIKSHTKYIDKRGNSTILCATTISHQDFNYFGNLFYKNKTKIVPDNLKFTPLSLAALIQDDGSLNKSNIRIASMSFTKDDNEKLTNYIKNLDLDCKVLNFKYNSKLYYQITFNKINTIKLSNLIKEYVVESMKYKIIA